MYMIPSPCLILLVCLSPWASLGAQMVKNLPARQETQVQSLGEEDPLEKAVATHSIILAWRIPWTEEPGRATVQDVAELDTVEATQRAHMHVYYLYHNKLKFQMQKKKREEINQISPVQFLLCSGLQLSQAILPSQVIPSTGFRRKVSIDQPTKPGKL